MFRYMSYASYAYSEILVDLPH